MASFSPKSQFLGSELDHSRPELLIPQPGGQAECRKDRGKQISYLHYDTPLVFEHASYYSLQNKI
jgi:hypothetical protein